MLGTATGDDDGAYEGSTILNILGTVDGVELGDALGAALGLNEGSSLGMLEGINDLNEGNSDSIAAINDGATEGTSSTNKTNKKDVWKFSTYGTLKLCVIVNEKSQKLT